jgi:hypothetical protein
MHNFTVKITSFGDDDRPCSISHFPDEEKIQHEDRGVFQGVEQKGIRRSEDLRNSQYEKRSHLRPLLES